MPVATMRKRSAAEVADWYADGMRGARYEAAQVPADVSLLDAYTQAARSDRPRQERLPALTTSSDPDGIVGALAGMVTVAVWQQHRIVYDMDPDLWAELRTTELDAVIPSGLLHRLPHANPFVALPEPVVADMAGDGTMITGGFFITGWTRHPDTETPLLVSTHSPAAGGNLALTFVATFETTPGVPLRIDGRLRLGFLTVRLNSSVAADMTLEQMIDGGLKDPEDADVWYAGTTGPVLIPQAMTALTYLCATNADLRPLPAPVNARRRTGTTSRRKPVKVITVGYTVGAALRAWRRREAARTAGHAGVEVRPHLRRAHFHTFLAGPGRSERRVKLLPPIPVNADGDATRTTNIPVPATTRPA